MLLHWLEPSVKVWRFHTGRRSLTSSTIWLHTAKASARWSELTATASAASPTLRAPPRGAGAPAKPKVSGAEQRAAQKESAAIERRLAKLATEQEKLSEQMSAHDASDYAGLAALGEQQQALQDEIDELEMRWLELSELLG